MIKVYIFNKSNDISRVYDLKKFFQCMPGRIYLAVCRKKHCGVNSFPVLLFLQRKTRLYMFLNLCDSFANQSYIICYTDGGDTYR